MTANTMKTVCLLGHGLPPFFMDNHPQSEVLESYAIDLWHAGFGVLSLHLNAPRADGLLVPEWLQLSFDERAIQKFADAVFVMPGWENDESTWLRVEIARLAQKPVFESLHQIVRWREARPTRYLTSDSGSEVLSEKLAVIRPIKIAFVVGKYFVGEKKNDILVPDRNAIHVNILEANRVAIKLWQEGIGAFTPHNNTHHFELKTKIGEPVYQEFDRLLLERLVDGLIVLPSWVDSSGGKKEVAMAQSLSYPVMNSFDIHSIRNWRDASGPVNVVQTVVLKIEKAGI